MKRMAGIWLLCLCCLFSFRPSAAWWSLLYPQSVYDAGAQEEGQVQIKWKLAEWIAKWF